MKTESKFFSDEAIADLKETYVEGFVDDITKIYSNGLPKNLLKNALKYGARNNTRKKW